MTRDMQMQDSTIQGETASTPSVVSRARRTLGRGFRGLATAAVGTMVLGAASMGCLNRPVADATPTTNNVIVDRVSITTVNKIDILFMIDNSASMADKQAILAEAVPDLVNRLVNPDCVRNNEAGEVVERKPANMDGSCETGLEKEFTPIADIHIGVVTSSLGGHGADICSTDPKDDQGGRLLTRGKKDGASGYIDPVPNYENQGFLAWDPGGKKSPPGEKDAVNLATNFADLVRGADQNGCGYEASLEAWYRFLVDPAPPSAVPAQPIADGKYIPAKVGDPDSTILAQRKAFLREDSLVAVINLSDENDCSTIDGALPAQVEGADGNMGPWPESYHISDNLDANTNKPFGPNYIYNQQQGITLARGTKECETNPYSAECISCFFVDPAEKEARGCNVALEDESPGLRCYNQKRRYGIETLYPVQRYIDGLTKKQIYDRGGKRVENPLLKNRPDGLVFYAGIVGVPWQDIAKNSGDLAEGFKTASEIDWEFILGDPRKGIAPKDPLMIETPNPRSGTNVLKEPVGAPGTWNSINGHEWETQKQDLQYACIFPLVAPQNMMGGDCDTPDTNKSPLCDVPTDMNNLGSPGTNMYTMTQYRAKAYPGTRFLQLLNGLPPSTSIVASICAANVTDNTKADFGYRPAVSAIIDRLKTQLKGRCVPRKLQETADGSTPCLIVEARFDSNSSSASQAEIDACKACDGPAVQPLSAEVQAALKGDIESYQCLCELKQVAGDDLNTCKSNPADVLPKSDGSGNITGWCYVDEDVPGLSQGEKDQRGSIVSSCRSGAGQIDGRTIRFLNTNSSGATLFITCLGGNAGATSGGGAGGSSGAAGSSGASGSSGAAGSAGTAGSAGGAN